MNIIRHKKKCYDVEEKKDETYKNIFGHPSKKYRNDNGYVIISVDGRNRGEPCYCNGKKDVFKTNYLVEWFIRFPWNQKLDGTMMREEPEKPFKLYEEVKELLKTIGGTYESE